MTDTTDLITRPGDTPPGSGSLLSSDASSRSASPRVSPIALCGLAVCTGVTGALLHLALILAKAGAAWPAVSVAGIAAGTIGLALMPAPVLDAIKALASRSPFGGGDRR